ncbi:uncharacterized protein LOC135367514 [Ornithodoros turicata]|uniref:uncharacterized protein LOC135367514 n=1 Tax=Ornithodoros turicata TaxID=34597 RepID=UPI003139E175
MGGGDNSLLFRITDRVSGCRFLVDTEADVSVVPPTPAEKRHRRPGSALQAVNKSSISTYGQRSVTLDLGLRRNGDPNVRMATPLPPTTSHATETTSPGLHHIAVKIPPFWPADPVLWFANIEAQFALRAITVQSTKFYHVVGALGPTEAAEVRDIITDPPSDNPYEALKTALTKRTTASEQECLRQLLTAEVLGDRKPSELLRRMQQLLGDKASTLDDSILRELFLQRLPNTVRMILTTSEAVSLQALAEMADKMIDIAPSTVCAALPQPVLPSVSDFQNLRDEASRLSKLVASSFRFRNTASSRPRSTTTRRQGFHRRSPSPQQQRANPDKCWYHQTFGNQALSSRQRLFCLTDRKTGVRFLVDTGAEVCVIPASQETKKHCPPSSSLQAVNGSSIITYGEKLVTLNLGLRRAFRCIFVSANVPHAIIGADFLAHFGLLVDMSRKRLIDTTTRLWVHAVTASSPSFMTVRGLAPTNEYDAILREFPTLTRPPNCKAPVKHDVVHHIITTGPPVHVHPRRLSPEKFKVAKNEFEHMLELGIIRPSSSAWSSALHLVPKTTGDWRLCGDYRALNRVTAPDRYPIPHMQDFANNLHGTRVFSKVDMIRAYHQIPVADEDIAKTALSTPFGLFIFQRMSFGLRYAAQTFQRFIDSVIRGLPFVFAYTDDLLVASSSPQEHAEHLRTLFTRLEEFGIVINPIKSKFGVEELGFLGHHISIWESLLCQPK